jgi:hypothetical protein
MEIDATSADSASESLDRMADSAAKAESATTSLEETTNKSAQTVRKAKDEAAGYTGAVQKQADVSNRAATTEREFERIERNLRQARLDNIAAMEKKKLAQEQEAKATAELKAHTQELIEKYTATKGPLDQINLSTKEVQRSLGVLGREVVRGDFNQMPGTLLRTAQHAGLATSTIITMVAPILAVVGAIVSLGKAFNQGQRETIAFNNAIVVSGNYAGLTRDKMLELARAVADAGGVTVGQAKDLVRELVASGQISSRAIADVAGIAEKYAIATRREVDQVGKDLIQIFSDPAKGAEQLARDMNLLDQSQLQYIKNLAAAGRESEAQVELVNRLKERLKEIQPEMGTLEKAWHALGKAASTAWDFMLNIGRPKSLQDQLKDAEAALEAARKRQAFRPNQNVEMFENAVAEVDRIKNLIAAEEERNRLSAERTTNQRQEREQAELMKKLTEQQLLSDVQIAETRARGLTQTISQLQEMNAITEEEAIRRRAIVDLAVIGVKEEVNARKQAREDIDAVERSRLDTEALILRLQRSARTEELNHALDMVKVRRGQAQAEADARASGATATSQLGDIQSLQQSNEMLRQRQRELGLTREQVDMLRQAELQAVISRKELEAAELEREGGDDSPYAQRLRREIELLRERQALEMSTDTISTQEAQFEAERKRLEEQREWNIITEQEFQEELLDLEVRSEARRLGITNRFALDRLKFEKMNNQQRVVSVVEMFAGMMNIAQYFGKEFFAITKAAAIASAIVNVHQGITAALTMKPPWVAFAYAAAVALKGFASVAAIQAQQMGGGGGGGGGAGSTPSIGSGGGPPEATPLTPAEPAKEPKTVIMEFTGTQSEEQLLEKFASMLNELNTEGGRQIVVRRRR